MIPSLATTCPASRDIWQRPPNQEPRIKYYAVPYDYDDLSIKHADLIGSCHGYKDGQVWLTLNGQRLFRMADDNSFPIAPLKFSTEVPIMAPDELKEVLKGYCSYEQMQADYMDYYAKREAIKKAGGQIDECEGCQPCTKSESEGGGE